MKSDEQNKITNAYDDDDIPKVDLPQNHVPNGSEPSIEPLPESSRPRKDGPGGA